LQSFKAKGMPDGGIQKFQSVKMLYFNYIRAYNKIMERKEARTEGRFNAIIPHSCSLLQWVVVLLNDDFELRHFPDQGITGNPKYTGRFYLVIPILMQGIPDEGNFGLFQGPI